MTLSWTVEPPEFAAYVSHVSVVDLGPDALLIEVEPAAAVAAPALAVKLSSGPASKPAHDRPDPRQAAPPRRH